jgi:hypothetical protein
LVSQLGLMRCTVLEVDVVPLIALPRGVGGARADSRATETAPRQGDTCEYEADNREFDDGEPEKVVVIDAAYLDTHAPIARERIAMAGVRLAGLLNQALGDQAPEVSLRAELLSRIEAISRDLAELRAMVEAMVEP